MSIFESQLHDSIIKKVPDTKQSSPCHYLPHHGARTVDKEKTKLHIIFNESAKADKCLFSLNNCLNIGPIEYPTFSMCCLNSEAIPLTLLQT